jgi:hypothetical protein
MKHPLKKCQKSQAEFLSKCPPEERAMHEYIFRVGNATYIYHQLADKEVDEKTQRKYYEEWLEGLPKNISKDMQKKGFKICKTNLSFTRYINERTDVGMDEWMRNHISEEDYKKWNNHE